MVCTAARNLSLKLLPPIMYWLLHFLLQVQFFPAWPFHPLYLLFIIFKKTLVFTGVPLGTFSYYSTWKKTLSSEFFCSVFTGHAMILWEMLITPVRTGLLITEESFLFFLNTASLCRHVINLKTGWERPSSTNSGCW